MNLGSGEVQNGLFGAIWAYLETQLNGRHKGGYSESRLSPRERHEMARVEIWGYYCLRIWSGWTDPITRHEIEDSMILGPYR